MIYKVSTTGAVSEVVLWDMGARTLTHPTVELDLGLEYTDDELIDSADLATAISNGWITLDEKSGGAVTEEEAIEIATETANTTVSGAVGGETATFLGLTDTPDTNPGYSYYYAVSSASGVEWKSDYLDGEIHISAEYDGDANGSATSPFNTIPEAAAFAYATYSGTGKKVAVIIHPGEYEISSPIDLALPEIEAFIGTDKKTVVLKPTAGMAGQPLIRVYKPLYARSITLDATDYPEFITTDQTAGIAILNQYPFTTIDIEDMDIKGFRAGMYSQIPAFVNAKHITIENTYIGICMSSGTVFTIDSPVIRGARERHLCVKSGSKAYVKGGFLSSTGVPGATNSGIALRAEGEDSKLEFYGGGSVTNVAKHVEVVDGGTVVVDGAILKEIENSPAITQDATSFLTITNSIAPLEADKLEINNPAGCNIFAYDSSIESLSIGTGDDSDQTLLTIIEGSSDRPSFDYKANYGPQGRKALVFESSKEGFEPALVAKSTNAEAGIGAHTTGTDGYDYEANLGLAGFENDIPKGWKLVKQAGETPNFSIQTTESGTGHAILLDYNNNFYLNSGATVNKILDEDNFASDDQNALVTQQSTKAYIRDYGYSTEESDINLTTLSGTLDDKFIWRDGSKQLTSDWDVGPYEIEADGFNIDDVELDLAGYTNITGILTGGTLSINTVDNAILDIAAGTGIFVEMTDRDNPVVETVTWTATTINPNLTGLRSKWIGMQRTAQGTVTPISAINFTQLEKRSIIILGRCWGNGTATITGRGNYKAGAFSFGKSMQDIAYALGSINITGNDFSATASGSLTLDRSAGESFRFMANYGNENISPNISKSTTASGIDKYSYHIQGQLYTNTETELDPDNYDLNGVKTAMPANKWQTQFVYYFPVSNTTHVVYGQHYHDDLDGAYEHLRSGESSYVLNTSILEGSILRSAIILKTGCDDLTDENQAKIIPITDSQFGSAGGGGGGVEDHGQLTGLLDDDHPQYHNDVRGDARYYTQAQVDTISGTITEEWINKDSAVVQVRRTTDYTPGTSWDDITFDTLDVESDSDVLEWDEANTDRLLVKLDGLYEISYSFPVRTVTTTTEIYARVMVDDTTQLDGSYTNQDLYQNETHQQDRTFRCYLSAGEYVTLQISTAAANHTVQGNAMISIAKLDGVPGPAGADGAQGPPGQDGVLTISGAADYFYGYDGAGTTQLATGSYTDIPHTTGYTTAAFSSNGTEVTIEQDNTFVITGRFTVRQTSSTRSEAWMRLVVDQGGGYTEIPGTFGACYSRNASQDKTTATATAVLDLVEGDKIKLQAQNNSGGGTMFGMQNGSSLQIFTTKGQTGPQGPSGPAGADGADGTDGADGVDAGGTLALLQARRTTTYSDIPTSWTDLTFDTTDLEYDDTVIEHDDTDRDRFQIKKDSYYYIAVNFSVDDETTVRIRKNDTTVLPGSTRPVGNTSDANDMVSALQNACIAQLDSGDYVTVQIQSTTSAENLYADATFIIFDMVGAKGADGAPGTPGSGSTINLKDEGSSVTNTPHSILNFTGDAVTVSDAGSGEATINITGGSNGVVVQEEGSTVTGGPHTTLNFVGSNITASNAGSGVATITTTAPVFGTEFAAGGEEGETNTNSTTGTEKAALAVTGIPAGTYRFGWYYEWRRNTTSNDYRALIELDGTTTIMDHREESQDVNSWHIEGGFYNVTLGAGNHTFSFLHYGESSNNTSYTRRLRMEIWRVA